LKLKNPKKENPPGFFRSKSRLRLVFPNGVYSEIAIGPVGIE